MFADPAVVNIAGTPRNLIRINQDKYSSEYLLRDSLWEYRMFVRNSSRFDKKRGVDVDRHNIELIHTVFAVPGTSPSKERKTYVVIENQRGDSLDESLFSALGLLAYLSATSGANITKMLNSES